MRWFRDQETTSRSGSGRPGAGWAASDYPSGRQGTSRARNARARGAVRSGGAIASANTPTEATAIWSSCGRHDADPTLRWQVLGVVVGAAIVAALLACSDFAALLTAFRAMRHRAANEAAAAERAPAAEIRNPGKHPHPVQKHLAKARRFAQTANQSLETAHRATRRAANIASRDVTAAYAATPTGAGLLSFNPPGVLLGERQKKRDEGLLQGIAPDRGMPRDVRLDMRVSVLGRRGG